MSEDCERVPPYSEEMEAAALGSMILEPMTLIPIAQRIGVWPRAFYVPRNRVICKALFDMGESAGLDRIDIASVMDFIKSRGQLDEVGGELVVDRLVDDTPTSAHGEYYLDQVKEKWILREIITVARGIENDCHRCESALPMLMSCSERFRDLHREAPAERSNEEVMQEAVARWEAAHRKEGKAIGLGSPWDKLTDILCGLEPGITILAGRPSEGKTTIEDQWSMWLAEQGIPVARVTLDSSRSGLLQRSLARKGGVSLPKLKFGFAGESQIAAVRSAVPVLGQYPVWINDRDRELRAICSWARVMKLEHDVKLLTVDYVQLVTASDMGKSNWDRVARVTHVSQTLKGLALDLEIPLLLLSQLSRQSEKDDRAPELSDLRDSGALEQDADKVVFVYKDRGVAKEMEEEKEGSTKKRRPTWMDVKKHKDGEQGRLPFWFLPHYFRFDETGQDFSRQHGEPEWMMDGGG